MYGKVLTTYQNIHNFLVCIHDFVDSCNVPMLFSPMPHWMIRSYTMYRKLFGLNHNNMLIHPTLQQKYMCPSIPTLLHHDEIIQVMVDLENDVRCPCIQMILHHLIDHPYYSKWKYLTIHIQVRNAINACHHNQSKLLEPLHLSSKSMMKEGTLIPLMIIQKTYKPNFQFPSGNTS